MTRKLFCEPQQGRCPHSPPGFEEYFRELGLQKEPSEEEAAVLRKRQSESYEVTVLGRRGHRTKLLAASSRSVSHAPKQPVVFVKRAVAPLSECG